MKTERATPQSVLVRRSADRGKTHLGWLDSRHSFSFGEYYDPEHMGFRSLRVINEDVVSPGMGFGTHPHRDMEILTWVVSGELQHRDSMGNGRIIKAGELQAMSAGSGITHSEFNPSRANSAHFVQIWITPSARGLKPSYAEWKPEGKASTLLVPLAGPTSESGAVQINQDAFLFLGRLAQGEQVTHTTSASRGLWIQVISGQFEVNGTNLDAGDAASVENVGEIHVKANLQGEFLLFDLA